MRQLAPPTYDDKTKDSAMFLPIELTQFIINCQCSLKL